MMTDHPDYLFTKYIEKLAFDTAVALGGLAVIAIAAATQVWDYPRPRTDFGILGLLAGYAALSFWCASGTMARAQESFRPEKFRSILLIMTIVNMFIGLAVVVVFVVQIGFYQRGTCLIKDVPVCTQKVEQKMIP
jgi:hypothetical protein